VTVVASLVKTKNDPSAHAHAGSLKLTRSKKEHVRR
jgi:hypothetical protein